MGSLAFIADTARTSRNRLGVLGILLLVSACSIPVERTQEEVSAPLVPFGDLFVLEDTIRLDPSVIVGHVDFVDFGPEGAFLASDLQSNEVHLFTAAGEHSRVLDPATCLPERSGLVRSARFVPPDRIFSLGAGGEMVVFTAEGDCVAAQVPRQAAKSACASGDTLHILPRLMSRRKHNTIAYSIDLNQIGSTRIALPKHPLLYQIYSSMGGRSIECFNDGPYYVDAGRADATPIRSPQNFAPARPPFFVERKGSLSSGGDQASLVLEVIKYPMNSGVLKIDGQTRLIVYHIPREQLAAIPEARSGFVVASNVGEFAARSTMSPVSPVGAADGYIYSVGDNVQMPDGDVGNPVLLRYKFTPPSDVSF